MLVTGAGGMVGSYVPEVFKDYDLVLTNTVEGYLHLDVRDPEAVMRMVVDLKPDVVLHLAAATDVDQCEKEPEWAFHNNAIGTQNVATRRKLWSWVFTDTFNSPIMDTPFDKSKLRTGDSYIGPVFTSPAVRGFVYLHVLPAILSYLKESSGVKRALLLVDGRNSAAVSFYKRAGFKEIVGAQPKTIISSLWRGLGRSPN